MRRIHLFEFEDLPWFPRSIRDAGTDYLRMMWEAGAYKPIVPRLRDALAKTGSSEILDLGSGGGGPIAAVYKELVNSGLRVRMTLSDKFPNLAAFNYARGRTDGGVDYVEESVDATAVPSHLAGFRTMFATLHHFRPELVRSILQDAVDQHCPIGVFDMTAMTPPPTSFLLLGNPLSHLLVAPFVRPFHWSRLLWTYLIPVVPLYVAWDGLVSGLRLYSMRELQKIVESLPTNDYVWKMGSERFPRSITYLIGYSESAIPASEREQA